MKYEPILALRSDGSWNIGCLETDGFTPKRLKLGEDGEEFTYICRTDRIIKRVDLLIYMGSEKAKAIQVEWDEIREDGGWAADVLGM